MTAAGTDRHVGALAEQRVTPATRTHKLTLKSVRFAAAALTLTLLAGSCRPPIADIGASPGATAEPTDTPAPAEKLHPDNQTNVELRIFRGYGPADAALLYGQALDSYRPVNLIVDIAPPLPGYDPFAVAAAPDSVTMWIGTVSDIAPSVATGLELVAVGELSGRDPTVIVAPTKSLPKVPGDLAGKTVIVDTAAAAASLRAAFAAAGGDPSRVKIKLPDDPSAPFDPTPLLDGTARVAAVSNYDGWARIEEGAVAQGLNPASFKEVSFGSADAPLLGELIWAQKSDLADPQLKAALTAMLGAVAQSQIACSQAVEDCAGALADQSDRSPEGLAWSVDQVDRNLFPAPDGILHIDGPSWDRTIAAMKAAGVAGSDRLVHTDDLVAVVVAALGSQLDFKGGNWTARTDLPLLP